MTNGDVVVQWRGLIIGGPGSPAYNVKQLSAAIGLPGASFADQESPRGHGSSVTPGVHRARIIVVDGFIRGTRTTRDGLVQALRAQMVPQRSTDAVTEPLIITAAGQTRTIRAQLSNFAVPIDQAWPGGLTGFTVQWRCPDPRFYGDPVTVTAALVAAVTGVTLPALLPMVLPAQPIGGRVLIINTGTDPEGSDAVYTVTGPLTGNVGVQNLTTNTTVIYALTLGAADFLVIDTHRGGAWLNGFAYRPPTPGSDVIAALRLAPGANLIQATGNPGVGSPAITVTTAPASW